MIKNLQTTSQLKSNFMVIDWIYLYPKMKNKTKMVTLATAIHITLEILSREFRKEKEIKVFQIRKEEIKFYLFEDDIMLCIENSKKSTKNYENSYMRWGSLQDTGSIYRSQLNFCVLAMGNLKIKWKTSIYHSIKKNGNKFNKKVQNLHSESKRKY